MAYYDNDRRYDRDDRHNDRGEDRNWFERATDEVSSWFSSDDDEAARYRAAQHRSHSGDHDRNYSDMERYRAGSYSRPSESQYGNSGMHNSGMHNSGMHNYGMGNSGVSNYGMGRNAGSMRRTDGYNYDYDNDYDGGQSYSRYRGAGDEHAATQNIRSYGTDRGYDRGSQGGYRGSRSFESDYGSDRGYRGQEYSGNGGSRGMYEDYRGSNDSRRYSDQDGRSQGNYGSSGRYGSYDGHGRTGQNYPNTSRGSMGSEYGARDNWATMEERSQEQRGYDMNEGRTGRNDWSNQRYGAEQGFGRAQDYRFNDRADRDYTRGYGNRYGTPHRDTNNYNSTNYGRR